MTYRYYLFVLIFLWSCSNVVNSPKETAYYGCYDEKEKLVLIDTDKYSYFEEVRQRVEQIVCHDSIPAIEVKHQNRTSILTLGNPCWEKYICILIKKKNIFKIVDNHIHFNKSYPLDSLEVLMKRHYYNYGQIAFHAQKPQKAIISINYKSNELKDLNYLLADIISSFDNIGVENLTCLSIRLDKDKQI